MDKHQFHQWWVAFSAYPAWAGLRSRQARHVASVAERRALAERRNAGRALANNRRFAPGPGYQLPASVAVIPGGSFDAWRDSLRQHYEVACAAADLHAYMPQLCRASTGQPIRPQEA